MTEKPFYMSKKFVYALSTLLAAIVLAVLPSVVTLDGVTVAMIEDMLPAALGLGFFVICGHTLSDAIVLSRGVENKPLPDAAHDFVDALPLGEKSPDEANAAQ